VVSVTPDDRSEEMSESETGAPPRIVREEYPPGVTCWVDVEMPDPKAGTEFYGGLFGWSFEDKTPDQPFHYFEATLDGFRVAAVGSQMERAQAPPAWNTYVRVEDADATARAVKDAGGAVLLDPMEIPGAGRMAVFADPQGAQIRIWEPAEHTGAQLVNEYGCWNFSGLSTTDTDAAASFYGAVFGWEIGGGSDGWSFFRVPGYGDFLERKDPDLRKRLAKAQGPEGFEDVTATMGSMEGQPAGTPPNWGVTFSFEDPDAGAERAKELGGKVLAEPFDVVPVRMAVLADPQGAVFTIAKYTPPND
jgi:uncharacterized protein